MSHMQSDSHHIEEQYAVWRGTGAQMVQKRVPYHEVLDMTQLLLYVFHSYDYIL